MSADKVIRGTIPDSESKDIPYSCWCGYKGTYDQREAHHDLHRRERRPQNPIAEALENDRQRAAGKRR